jgi:hypothetical protein
MPRRNGARQDRFRGRIVFDGSLHRQVGPLPGGQDAIDIARYPVHG